MPWDVTDLKKGVSIEVRYDGMIDDMSFFTFSVSLKAV